MDKQPLTHGGGVGGGRRGAKRPRASAPPPPQLSHSHDQIERSNDRHHAGARHEKQTLRPLGVVSTIISITTAVRATSEKLFGAADTQTTHGGDVHGRRRRRRPRPASRSIAQRSGSVSRAAAAIAIALVTVSLSTNAAGAAAGAAAGLVSEHRLPASGPISTATAARLCSPADDSRAYVTTLASGHGAPGGGAIGARVLAQSLRSAGAMGDVVVLVPLDKASGENVESLRRDGLTVHIVPRGLQSAEGEIASEDLMTKVFLWSLASYDRVVYLDPRSLIQQNPDALFACDGFCAAGAVYSSSPAPPSFPRAGAAPAHDSEDDDDATAAAAVVSHEKPLSGTPSWQPSTSVMVLEPSIDVHMAMLDELTRTHSVGSLEAQVFLSSFLGAAEEQCTPFDDLAGAGPGAGAAGGAAAGKKRSGGGGWMEEDDVFGFDKVFGGAGGRGGGYLEDALMPVVLLNGPHMPRCAPGRERTPAGVCHRLPYTYAAPSTDFHGNWGGKKQATDPHIIHFADEDAPWKRLAHLHKPLFWQWNKYREQLEYPYGNFFAPWILFFIPCVVLAFARVYYKIAGAGGGGGGGVSTTGMTAALTASAGDESSPSKRRTAWFRAPKQTQRQVAILPSCGMASAYDGGPVGLSLEAAAMYRSSSGGAVGSDISLASGGEAWLPVGVCYLLSALVAAFGVAWFRVTCSLAREVVDASWHPVISVAVYNAWICCALVIGLYVVDYVYYALVTRGRTVLKDAAAVAAFVAGVSVLRYSSAGGAVWAGAIGVGVIALGIGHGSRAGATHHLSGRAHFRCITASCVAGTLVSLTMCYNGAKDHQVGSRRAQAVVAAMQMVFTALVYASVVGGARLRADMDEAGSKISRSCSTPSFVEDALIAATPGTSPTEGKTASPAADARPSVGWSAPWVVALNSVLWVKEFVWRRRVAACLAVLVMWKVSATLRPTTPTRRFEKYGQSCLGNQDGFVEAGGKRLSKVCGAGQALTPVATGAYFEAFRQDKVCLEVAGGGFLTLNRVHVAPACTPENQFVFQQFQSTTSKSKARAGSPDALSSAPAKGSPDQGEYCVYNPTTGFYLSSQGRAKEQCGPQEHWQVRPAPRALGLKGAPRRGRSRAQSSLSKLTHPNYLSSGPLHTFYGYLLAATALLIARGVLAKLAASQSTAGARRDGSASGSGVSLSKQRHGGLGARQRSRGRNRSRSQSNNGGNLGDTGYFGDPGYAGDAEAGSASYGVGGSSRARPPLHQPFSAAPDLRGLSESPVAGCQRAYDGWGADAMLKGDCGMPGVGWSPSRGFSNRSFSFSKEKEAPAPSSGPSRAAFGDSLLVKVLHGLCLACDAALLAGLWCLLPAHFAQALSALTHDHHSAIGQGLGMDSYVPGSNNAWSRSLGEGGGGAGSNAGEAVSLFNLADLGAGAAGSVASEAESCEGGAWWMMATLVRWHLVLLLVAFCHLHGAVAAAAASGSKGRNRRTGKKVMERASLWGLRSGERLAMRLRTALGVLTLLCAAATAIGAELGEGSGLILLALKVHPSWGKCSAAAGLDGSWGIVSPLLVFAVLASAAGVYVRAGASSTVRLSAATGLLVAGAVVGMAAGKAYLVLAAAAVGMDWVAWGIAGVLSCVCYQGPAVPVLQRDSSGSAASVEDCGVATTGAGGDQHRGCGSKVTVGGGARHRSGNDTRRIARERPRGAQDARRGSTGAADSSAAGLILC